MTEYPTEEVLEERLAELGSSPGDRGIVEMIVSRPKDDERQELEHARLDLPIPICRSR